MSGGGGGSGNDSGGSDMQVSGMEAAYSNEVGISTNAESRTGSTAGYNGSDGGWAANDTSPDTSTVGFATDQGQGTVDSEDEYDAPDKDHYNQTQKEITQAITGLGDNNQSDWSDLSKVQQEQYQLEMNKVKGTEGKNYSFYVVMKELLIIHLLRIGKTL